MSVLTIEQAQARYPEAWFYIQEEMQQEAGGLDLVLEPISAEVVRVDGEMMLEVVAESDLLLRDDDGEEADELATLTFRAKLAAA